MASLLNVPNCGGSTSKFNTGLPVCDIIRDQPYMLFAADKGVEFSPADMADIDTFVAKVQELSRAPRGGRIYPISGLTGFEDNSKEATKATIGNLTTSEVTKNEAIPAFTFQHYKGDLFHQQLGWGETANLTWFILDKKYAFYGTQTSAGNLAGYTTTEFKALQPKFATATDTAKYPFSIVFASLAEHKENFAFVQLDETIVNVSGVIPVTLKEASIATNTISVKAVARGGKSMGVNYSIELADTDAWVLTKASDGSSVTTSGVTYNSTTDKFQIVTSGLSTGDVVNVTMATCQDLSDLGVDGYEAENTVQVTKA